jgi:5-methylcytosine-specific restriction protein A
MTFADLSSARAVEQAVEEFDRLGRDAFLAKYGVRPAQAYFLEIDGGDSPSAPET